MTALSNDTLYFTRGSRRHARIGDTMRVVTEGARVEITLGSDGTTSITVTHEAGVKVTKRLVAPKPARKPARPAAVKAAPKATAPKAARRARVAPEVRAEARAQLSRKPAAAEPAAKPRAAVRSSATRGTSPQARLAAIRSRARVSA